MSLRFRTMLTAERNKLQELIILGSPRVGFHPVIPYHRQVLDPLVKEHAQYLSYDNALVNGIILCKICNQIVTNARWNKKFILKHLLQVHHLGAREKPMPKLNNSKPANEPVGATPPNPVTSDKGNEETNPLPYEVVVIDDDPGLPLPPVKSSDNSVPKKKRGRKPKDRSTGDQQRPNKKPDKKHVSRNKEREPKKPKLKKEEAAKETCDIHKSV